LIKNKSRITELRAIRARHRSEKCNQRTNKELRLCPFLLSFCDGPAPFASNRRWYRRKSAAAAHNGMMLLIFLAGLIRRFRIVSTVTILQHAVLPFAGTADGVDRHPELPREYSAKDPRES
jgi:hypothetical protein